MKKILISLTFFIGSIIMTTNAQLPNSSFENWTGGDPVSWSTSNDVPFNFSNITPTTDQHTGIYAVHGEVLALFKPAFITNKSYISEKYLSSDLYYKFSPVGGDIFFVRIQLTKASNLIGTGVAVISSSESTYTHLTIPLNYTINDVPDSVYISISIRGANGEGQVNVGSIMFVDDVSFSISTGIDNILVSNQIGSCYPNPSRDIINIPLNENVSTEVILNVFDTFGRQVKTLSFQPIQDGKNDVQFSVGDLSSGLYVYSINGKNEHYQGKFTVCRK